MPGGDHVQDVLNVVLNAVHEHRDPDARSIRVLGGDGEANRLQDVFGELERAVPDDQEELSEPNALPVEIQVFQTGRPSQAVVFSLAEKWKGMACFASQ